MCCVGVYCCVVLRVCCAEFAFHCLVRDGVRCVVCRVLLCGGAFVMARLRSRCCVRLAWVWCWYWLWCGCCCLCYVFVMICYDLRL